MITTQLLSVGLDQRKPKWNGHEETLGFEGKSRAIILPCSTGIMAHLGAPYKKENIVSPQLLPIRQIIRQSQIVGTVQNWGSIDTLSRPIDAEW
mmetsp:Transcript_27652/g.28057  ORF Transcript_27652/g.28057 Transcript_27652/m.28057 type:complete len:94 (-) Transcript_27652:778-1059(-)